MANPNAYVPIMLQAAAVKTEATIGLDAFGGSPALSDFVGAEISVRLPQQAAEDPSVTGSFDTNAPIVTGVQAEITFRFPFRGVATPGTAPEWGKLAKACRMIETLTASAIGAPTAATAGTATTVTLPATPFSSVAQAYRGMPAALSGNPAAGDLSVIDDYTAARVARFPETFAAPLSTATLVQILPNALYAPTSDLTLLKPVTIYGYKGGLRHRFVGCQGSFRLEMTAKQPAMLVFVLKGVILDAYQPVALPTGWNTARSQPPAWIGGISQLDQAKCTCQRFNFDFGVQSVYPDDPEGAQGYDTPQITGADQRIEIDPYTNTTRSPTRFTKYQAGQAVQYAAMIGSTAGNRLSLSVPSAIITSMDEGNREKLMTDQMQLATNVPDASVFLAVF